MDKRIDSAEISRLRGLCEAATPGPWKDYRDTFEPAVYTKLEDGCRGACISRLAGLYTHGNRENAAFIAASRQALPELLDEIERLKKLVDNNSAMGADRNDILIEAVAAANAADARIERLQAEAAILRGALDKIENRLAGVRVNPAYLALSGVQEVREIIQALQQSTAGADLLERVQRMEAALKAFIDDAEHTRIFLKSRQIMHPTGLQIWEDIVATGKEALQKEAAPNAD